MGKLEENRIRISVRNLVEFLLRSGDIDNRRGGKKDMDAMAAGARAHRKIQGRMGGHYRAEVSLKREFTFGQICILLEGRADGIFEKDGSCYIDEIKGIYGEIDQMEEPVPVHRAQAVCYAFLYLLMQEDDAEQMGIQMTYCQLESEEIRRFEEVLTRQEILDFGYGLLKQYAVWGNFMYQHRTLRNATIRELAFPFSYRPGQKDLAVSVYRTIERKKKLFIQAPTGIGKTMSVLFPAVKAVGEGKADKIFYLTARTITRTVAQEAVRILSENGMKASVITLTAKEKLCSMEPEGGRLPCNPAECVHADGHFDRINEAVFSYLQTHDTAEREEILAWAEKYCVCPHELALDLSEWMDFVICDYNYVFDPNVQLKRYFAEGGSGDYLFLVDEAHNLVERAREMYSASLYKEDFLEVKKLVQPYSKKLEKKLERCNRLLLEMKREGDGVVIRRAEDPFALALVAAFGEMEVFLENNRELDRSEAFSRLYLAIRHFLNMYDRLDESYCIYSEPVSRTSFLLRLLCVDPSNNLLLCLDKAVSTIFFSATLLPVQYYKELLCGSTEEYAVYARSPFEEENRLLVIGEDVSSRYTRRNKQEFDRIAEYILKTVESREGNYLVFAPSYSYLESVVSAFEAKLEEGVSADTVRYMVQDTHMTEEKREQFLAEFSENGEGSLVGFGVMGGVFSEGIDLKGERLIGVVIIGTGLAQICSEREVLRQWYEKNGRNGFDYAYRVPGMNKVLQAAGRVIRTDEDRGVIMLLDDRFLTEDYLRLFPREWGSYYVTECGGISKVLETFWKKKK